MSFVGTSYSWEIWLQISRADDPCTSCCLRIAFTTNASILGVRLADMSAIDFSKFPQFPARIYMIITVYSSLISVRECVKMQDKSVPARQGCVRLYSFSESASHGPLNAEIVRKIRQIILNRLKPSAFLLLMILLPHLTRFLLISFNRQSGIQVTRPLCRCFPAVIYRRSIEFVIEINCEHLYSIRFEHFSRYSLQRNRRSDNERR